MRFGQVGQGVGPYGSEGVGIPVGVRGGVLDELGLGSGAERGRDHRTGDRCCGFGSMGRTDEMEAEVDAGRSAR